jgi:hypothetical protein
MLAFAATAMMATSAYAVPPDPLEAPRPNYGTCVKNDFVTPGMKNPDGLFGPSAPPSTEPPKGTVKNSIDGRLPFIAIFACAVID